MSTLSQLETLKRKAEQMRQERDRAQGRLEEAKERLSMEFEVDSVEDAEKLLKKLKAKEAKAKEQFETAMEEFNEKWGDKLDGE